MMEESRKKVIFNLKGLRIALIFDLHVMLLPARAWPFPNPITHPLSFICLPLFFYLQPVVTSQTLDGWLLVCPPWLGLNWTLGSQIIVEEVQLRGAFSLQFLPAHNDVSTVLRRVEDLKRCSDSCRRPSPSPWKEGENGKENKVLFDITKVRKKGRSWKRFEGNRLHVWPSETVRERRFLVGVRLQNVFNLLRIKKKYNLWHMALWQVIKLDLQPNRHLYLTKS